MKRPRMPGTWAVLASLALACSACSAIGTAESSTNPAPSRPSVPGRTLPLGISTTIVRVVDGDTVVVKRGERVRLIGVDTPETKDPRRPVQCFGREASKFLSSVLPVGTAVHLVADVEQRDHFDRLLAYVYRLPDGLFVNAELLKEGYAQVLTISPNVAHADEFVTVAGEARDAGRGLWGACG